MDSKEKGEQPMEQRDYVLVCLDESAKGDGVELPLEGNGTMLLSVLQSQFNAASGLKYRQVLIGVCVCVCTQPGRIRYD